jgi:molecular chaperone HscB
MICPHCKDEISSAENCPQCGRILSPTERSHFQVFGLPEDQLSLDEGALEKRFLELSRKYHPDRFASKSPLEIEIAHEYSSALNNAFRTLKDPISRAKYVVEHKLGSFEEKSAQVPADMAEFFFEIHDVLDTIRDSDGNPPESALKEVESAEKQLSEKVQELEEALQSHFANYDQSADQKELEKIKQILHERSYIRSFLRQIDHIVHGGEPIIH